jgi:hypothetical protein
MKHLLLLAFYFFVQVDIPFKSADEFQVNIDLKFKPRPQKDSRLNSDFKVSTQSDTNISAPEAFLNVNITQLKVLSDEVKILAFDSKEKMVVKKKCTPDDIQLEMGFVNDLKSGAAANQVTIYFLSAEKRKLRKIELTILPDGVFQVNGKWHGQF